MAVALGHACHFWTGDWFTCNPIFKSQVLSMVTIWLNSFHIYAFTLISGYLFTYITLRGGYSNYWSFLKAKAKRLLIPYVFVMPIWAAPISSYFLKMDDVDLFKNFVLCVNPRQLWFLWMLFGVFAIVWPFRTVMIERPVAGWMIALAFCGIGYIGYHFIPNVFCIWTACQYVIFFYIGMRMRVKSEQKERLITDVVPWYCWLTANIALLAGLEIIDLQSGFLGKVTMIGLKILLHVIGAIMAWTTLQVLASRAHWQDCRAVDMLASYSMPMYLFHEQIIYFTIVTLNGVVNPWINAGANFVVAVAGSFLISALLMRWKVTRFLIGEK